MYSVLIVNDEQDILEVTRLFPERFVGENTAIEALNNGACFFIKKKCRDLQAQFRKKVHMINQAVEHRSMGRAIGTSERLLVDHLHFFRTGLCPHGTRQRKNSRISNRI